MARATYGKPDVLETETSVPEHSGHSPARTGLLLLAIFYTLYFARAVAVPVTIAILLTFLGSPIVRRLERWNIPRVIGSALVLIVLLASLGLGVKLLSGPAKEWVTKAPQTLRQLERRVQDALPATVRLKAAAEEIQQITTDPQDGTPTVQVKPPTLRDTALVWTKGFVGGAVVTFVLQFFLLLTGDVLLTRLPPLIPRIRSVKHTVQIVREIEQTISAYLLTITMINACLGLAVGLAMLMIGQPNPVLWGVLAALLNFVPYFGPMTGCVVLLLTGMMQSQSLGHALLPPAIYLGLHAIESNLVTPTLLGRRLQLNPAIIFLSLVFWGWLWGLAGAIMAIPFLMILKIICDHIESLEPLGKLIES